MSRAVGSTSCEPPATRCLGSIYCEHAWVWSGEIFTTYPGKQHRRCRRCGRRECIEICGSEQPREECPGCEICRIFKELESPLKHANSKPRVVRFYMVGAIIGDRSL